MLFKMAFRNALKSPRRSLVTAVTVAIGAGGLFLFQAFNAGIMTGNRDHTIHAKYGYGQVTLKGYRDQAHEKPWQHWIEDGDNVKARLANIPHVTHVFPRVEFFGLLGNGQTNVGGRGIGIDGPKEADFFHGLRIISGKSLEGDQDGIVLGKGLAKALNVQPGDTVTVLGNTVRGSINGLDLAVTGIFEVGLREIDDTLFQIQISRARELLDTSSVEYFSLGIDELANWPQVSQAISQEFPNFDVRSFAELDKVWYQHTVDWLGEQFQIIRLIILTIVLLGIFNLASFALLERTRELGTLRANGESASDLIRMLVWEGLLVGGFGSFLGITGIVALNATVLSAGITMSPPPGYTQSLPVFLELSFVTAFVAFALATTTAVFATLAAGRKIARMPIAEALRAI